MIDLIAFDADDTLWHSEIQYARVQNEFIRLLGKYNPPGDVDQALQQTEIRNLPYYGYGAKAFALSLIETAIEVTGGLISASEIKQLIDMGKEMLVAEVELLDGVQEVIQQLAGRYTLMLITKGDLGHQEAKVAGSGLANYFNHIEIVSEKDRCTYAALLTKYQVSPSHFLMVGNSLRSDILPVVELGGQAVYIPYQITWAHEQLEILPAQHEQYFELEHLGQLPILLELLENKTE